MNKQEWAWAASVAAWIIAWGVRAALVATSLVGSAFGQLMPPERVATLRSHLPQVDDRALAAALADPGLLFYTVREMPGAYQDWDGALPGVHSVSYNISMVESEPHGNANQEFPWGDPGGLHRTENTDVFRFVWLPLRPAGGQWPVADGQSASGHQPQATSHQPRLPVVWYRKHYPGSHTAGYSWLFPRGTIVGEVLLLDGPDGREYPFEVRIRTRAADGWEIDTFRPFPSWESLAERIRELEPDWQAQPQLVAAIERLESPPPLRTATLRNPHPAGTRFEQTALLDELPPLDAQLVARLLLETPFKSAVGSNWRETHELAAAAPVTRAAFHIVPARYDGAFVPVDHESCSRCHENIGDHARRFAPFRDWYGRIRGSDGIFSFHPFAIESISNNGFGRPVAMRRELVQAGLLERYDPQRHTSDFYRQTNRGDAETRRAE